MPKPITRKPAAPWLPLSPAQRQEIDRLYATTGIPHRELARHFGVRRDRITRHLAKGRWLRLLLEQALAEQGGEEQALPPSPPRSEENAR